MGECRGSSSGHGFWTEVDRSNSPNAMHSSDSIVGAGLNDMSGGGASWGGWLSRRQGMSSDAPNAAQRNSGDTPGTPKEGWATPNEDISARPSTEKVKPRVPKAVHVLHRTSRDDQFVSKVGEPLVSLGHIDPNHFNQDITRFRPLRGAPSVFIPEVRPPSLPQIKARFLASLGQPRPRTPFMTPRRLLGPQHHMPNICNPTVCTADVCNPDGCNPDICNLGICNTVVYTPHPYGQVPLTEEIQELPLQAKPKAFGANVSQNGWGMAPGAGYTNPQYDPGSNQTFGAVFTPSDRPLPSSYSAGNSRIMQFNAGVRGPRGPSQLPGPAHFPGRFRVPGPAYNLAPPFNANPDYVTGPIHIPGTSHCNSDLGSELCNSPDFAKQTVAPAYQLSYEPPVNYDQQVAHHLQSTFVPGAYNTNLYPTDPYNPPQYYGVSDPMGNLVGRGWHWA